tara:strand:+ start:3699 stop:3854 length:156 start_codon:yes stop_codon:yes gene_type:complete
MKLDELKKLRMEQSEFEKHWEHIKGEIFICSEWVDEMLKKIDELIEATRRV